MAARVFGARVVHATYEDNWVARRPAPGSAETAVVPDLLKGFGVTTVVIVGAFLESGHHPHGGTRHQTDYAEQVLDNTIAVLGRLTTVNGLVAEWEGRPE